MTPTDGSNTADQHRELIRYGLGTSSLGPFLAAVSDVGIVAFEFGNAHGLMEDALKARFHAAQVEFDQVGLGETISRLAALIENPNEDPELTLDPRGSKTQLQLWRLLQRIPVGETTNYGEIAKQAGIADTRIVTEAIASNGIAILIPCHRVVKKNGSVSGYRWGARRKHALLARERRGAPP